MSVATSRGARLRATIVVCAFDRARIARRRVRRSGRRRALRQAGGLQLRPFHAGADPSAAGVDARALLADAGVLAVLRLAHPLVRQRLVLQGLVRDLSGAATWPASIRAGSCTTAAATGSTSRSDATTARVRSTRPTSASQAFRDYWIAQAKASLAQGYKGVFIDDVNMLMRVSDGDGHVVAPRDPRTGRAMTPSAWRRYMADFMVQVRAALPSAEIVHNALWFVGDGDPAGAA